MTQEERIQLESQIANCNLCSQSGTYCKQCQIDLESLEQDQIRKEDSGEWWED